MFENKYKIIGIVMQSKIVDDKSTAFDPVETTFIINIIIRFAVVENPTKNLSIHYLKTHLTGPMNKRQIYYYCTHSNFIERAKPFEVGSHKTNLNVFNYKV